MPSPDVVKYGSSRLTDVSILKVPRLGCGNSTHLYRRKPRPRKSSRLTPSSLTRLALIGDAKHGIPHAGRSASICIRHTGGTGTGACIGELCPDGSRRAVSVNAKDGASQVRRTETGTGRADAHRLARIWRCRGD